MVSRPSGRDAYELVEDLLTDSEARYFESLYDALCEEFPQPRVQSWYENGDDDEVEKAYDGLVKQAMIETLTEALAFAKEGGS